MRFNSSSSYFNASDNFITLPLPQNGQRAISLSDNEKFELVKAIKENKKFFEKIFINSQNQNNIKR